MKILSIKGRVDRIMNSNRLIYLEDMTIHEPDSVKYDGDKLMVVLAGGLTYLDTDLMTLDEACDGERFLNKVKQILYK